MRYAALGPGKRIRPAVVHLSFETAGGRGPGVWPLAAAVELVHAFSLAHDDLPCMDDDDLRRGRPTLHRRFGEPVALLAGDALLAAAFGAVAAGGARGNGAGPRAACLAELAGAAGWSGMVGGQVLDMLAEGRPAGVAQVRNIHARKTAALLRAAARIGALWAGAKRVQVDRLGGLAEVLGNAFQVGDDLLNATSATRALGKSAGSDARRGKATYPRAAGLAAARAELARLCAEGRLMARGLPARTRPRWAALVDLVETRRS